MLKSDKRVCTWILYSWVRAQNNFHTSAGNNVVITEKLESFTFNSQQTQAWSWRSWFLVCCNKICMKMLFVNNTIIQTGGLVAKLYSISLLIVSLKPSIWRLTDYCQSPFWLIVIVKWKPKLLQQPTRKVNTFKSLSELKVKTCKSQKCSRATKSWLVLVLHPIDSERGVSFLDQSPSEVKQKQHNTG